MKPSQASDPFDDEEPIAYLESSDDADKVLAEYIVASASINIQDKRKQRTSTKGACRNMSQHDAAVAFHRAEPTRDAQFDQLLKSLSTATAITDDQSSALRSGTKRLYREFLVQFKGIICATPMAAAHLEFRSWFRPNLIAMDEGSRLPEIELLTILAFYDAPLVIVGDHQQLALYLEFEPQAKNDYQSRNPFAPRLRYSTLERAVDAGAIDSFLRFNHRSFAFLSDLPSRFIYRSLMRVYSEAKQWPEAAENFNGFLREIAPDIPDNQNRLLVTLPGSWVSYIGTSARNIAHARWIIDTAIKAVHRKDLKSLDGSPIDVLVMPYYRAQVQTIEQMLNQAVPDGKLTMEERSCIRVQTLDSSQGDEADPVIVG